MDRWANISPDGVYRYRLGRDWGAVSTPMVTWIMLNPSTADANDDDPTIRKCIGFTKLWGFSRLQVVNLFALRSTDHKELRKRLNPVGPLNDNHVYDAIHTPGLVVAAWGNNVPRKLDAVRSRYLEYAWFGDIRLKCFGLTKKGQPFHPLFQPYSKQLVDLL
jgi:hypothetical protein